MTQSAQSARWFLDVTEEILGGIGARTDPTFGQFLQETGGLEGLDISFVQVAYGFAPQPLTPAHFVKRTPYANPEAYRKQMDESVERGWLKAVGEGEYKLTAKGKEVVEHLWNTGDEVFGGLESLPDADMKQIIALLQKVVDKVREMPEPAEKWAFSWGSKFDRGPKAPLMVQARRRLLDLLALRDDVHIAAWQPYDVSGQAWEAFTFAWRGDAGTAAELAEKLPFRNYDGDAYAAALKDLVARGWIAKENDRYVATEKGKKLRQKAEEATDRYFDAAWVALSEAETKEIKGLLKRLAKAVKPPEPEKEE
jgi:DNA-binding MarR family transcriptional regulator